MPNINFVPYLRIPAKPHSVCKHLWPLHKLKGIKSDCASRRSFSVSGVDRSTTSVAVGRPYKVRARG